CSSAACASASLALKGASSMTNRSWHFLTSAPSWKWISLRDPRTRARIETSWSARVVPIGSAMTGTVIRRASTTVTTGGGGVRAAPTFGEHPGVAADARAATRAIHPRPLDPLCVGPAMILPPQEGGFQSTGQGVAAQIDPAYSAIVRSLENFPDRATL